MARGRKMKKQIKLFAGCIVLIIVAYAYAHIAKTVSIYDKGIDPSQYGSTGIIIDQAVSQSRRKCNRQCEN